MTDVTHRIFNPLVINYDSLRNRFNWARAKNSGVQIKHKIELDIICFLAENGPHSVYDMFKGPIIQKKPKKPGRPPRGKREKLFPKRKSDETVPFEYKRILRHANNLVNMNLLQLKKLNRKNILSLTFNGFYIYLQDRIKTDQHFDTAIRSNSGLLPFSEYWNEIVQIVGQNVTSQGLREAVYQQIYRSSSKIKQIDLEFEHFLVEPRPIFPQIVERKLNKDFIDFLSKNLVLRNSYVSYLATHDIFFLTSKKKWSEIDSYLSKLESEKALAFFEKRSIHDKSLFMSGIRLREFFPRFATVEYFFTGMLMEKLLLKENRVDEDSSNDE